MLLKIINVNTKKESGKIQESSAMNIDELNTNKHLYGDEKLEPKKDEIIKRIKKAPLIDMVQSNDVYFLAMGINRISENFASEEELEESINSNWLEIVCNIAMTVTTVISKSNENGK